MKKKIKFTIFYASDDLDLPDQPLLHKEGHDEDGNWGNMYERGGYRSHASSQCDLDSEEQPIRSILTSSHERSRIKVQGSIRSVDRLESQVIGLENDISLVYECHHR